MTTIAKKRRDARIKRHRRVRFKVNGTADRPRLSVHRSIKNITAQIHIDTENRCVLTVTSLSAEVRDKVGGEANKMSVSKAVGSVLAEKAKAMGIHKVAFDRGGYLYHGRVKALAEGAREGGLEL
jgi:large subunit ribosomal protein L18